MLPRWVYMLYQREKLWYALLMRANKPETAVQSSHVFSLGITWYFLHVVSILQIYRAEGFD